MKKISCLFLAVLMLLGLFACDSISLEPTTLQSSMAIPENGIVQDTVFQELKDQNKVVTFTGESNGIRYEWTVFGSDIEQAQTLNLGIEFTEKSTDKIAFRYLSEEAFGFSPVLSIYLDNLWDVQSATVYQVSGTETAPICSATVTGSGKSILNFSVITQVGCFEILPDVVEDPSSAPSNAQDTQIDKKTNQTVDTDSYLSGTTGQSSRILSDGKTTEQDQYQTDPIPEGKPLPVEPEEQTVDKKKTYTCTFSIECSTILNHLGDLESNKLDEVPSNGIILAKTIVTFYEGESVYDVLQRVCRENGVHLEASWTPIYNSAYVEGIHNLYEFDCGSLSGWMYRVNGWYPNYGCSRYQLAQDDVVEWRYTCDLGNDIGGGYAVGSQH